MNRISPETINRLVFNLQKPARYLGGELNTITRERAIVRMAICYPDLYEVGMSNHGIRIIYDLANRVENAACERVFAVAPDFEEKARGTGVPLYTLETRTPLRDLDLLGFTVSHELLATNILQILDLGGIPLERKDRGEEHPLVMAGGEGISNPAPLMDFMDLFYLGDGEEGIAEILGALNGLPQQQGGVAVAPGAAVNGYDFVIEHTAPLEKKVDFRAGLAVPFGGLVR